MFFFWKEVSRFFFFFVCMFFFVLFLFVSFVLFWLRCVESEYPPFPSSLVDESCLAMLFAEVKSLLAKEPHVVEVDGFCRLFGDIHGQFLDLMQVRNATRLFLCLCFLLSLVFPSVRISGSTRGKSRHDICFPGRFCWQRVRFVFGVCFFSLLKRFYSLETVLLLFSLKVVSPSRVVLVRGNHESRSMSWQFGFREGVSGRMFCNFFFSFVFWRAWIKTWICEGSRHVRIDQRCVWPSSSLLFGRKRWAENSVKYHGFKRKKKKKAKFLQCTEELVQM